MIPFIIQGNNIVLYVENRPVVIDSSHINYAAVKQAIRDQCWDTVATMATVKNAVNKLSKGRVTVTEDEVTFDGKVIHNALSKRMLQIFSEGFPIDHFCKFMERLDANPSYRARNELYGFLEACDLPITDDGCFLAYKKIRFDWKDCYSGTIDNRIGTTPTMDRRDVNEDPNQTCSAGLHVCSYSYLKSYSGDRIVAVKVDPADVVSCPVDYNFAKLRVCKYEVVEELAFDAAQSDNILSQGPAVRTGYVQSAPTPQAKARTSLSVEDVLYDMDLNDKTFVDLCAALYVDHENYYDPIDLIEDVRIGKVRAAMISLGMI
jgi:hypothetical protein